MGLAIRRKAGESVVVRSPEGVELRITLVECDKGRCKLDISAPRDWAIWRSEIDQGPGAVPPPMRKD